MFSYHPKRVLNPTSIDNFINSTVLDGWNYINALGLDKEKVLTATHDQILDNPNDVVDGVVHVEVVLNTVFFGIFDSLIVKYRDNQSVQLMFYTTIDDAQTVLSFFQQLRTTLGGGILADHKFSSFNESDKVDQLTRGEFEYESDELMHLWHSGDFSFTLNYRIDPLRQFLFIVQYNPRGNTDRLIRTNGTLLNILGHDLTTVLQQEELESEPKLEQDKIKFVDYTFVLSPSELGVFDEIKIRVFDESREINENIQTHVTYYSKYEVDTSKAIILCDKIIAIYGRDNYGDAELQPHELDMLENSETWTGRTWWLNKAHGLYDLNDPNQNLLYEIRLGSDDDVGFSLHVLCFDKMLEYHKLMNS